MNCPEKVSLQQQVKDGWSAYEMAVKESGVYADALSLRGEHLRASRELSRHLSRHRC